MLYLSGVKNPTLLEPLRRGEIGLLYTPRAGYRLDGVATWACDNGCFNGHYPGDEGYLLALDGRSDHIDRCLFVAAPDVLGDSDATLSRFPQMASKIRARGWPVALVGQDGMENRNVPWDDLDWIFIGGSTEWKLGPARVLIASALQREKKVHVGRVNSAKRYRLFRDLGCNSADGTFLAYGPAVNLERMRLWWA